MFEKYHRIKNIRLYIRETTNNEIVRSIDLYWMDLAILYLNQCNHTNASSLRDNLRGKPLHHVLFGCQFQVSISSAHTYYIKYCQPLIAPIAM